MQTPTHQREDPIVKGVLERWDDQGLAGEPWPFVAMCSLSRLQQVLARALELELKRFHISRTGYFALTTLALISGRCSALSTLGRLLNLHPTTVKLTIDQLEAEGLAVRHPHPHDRRTTLVQITEAGMDRIRAANRAVGEAEAGVLNAVAPHLQDLVSALQPARMAVCDTDYPMELEFDPALGVREDTA